MPATIGVLVGRHCHHRLVQQRHACDRLALHHQRLTSSHTSKRHQIRVAEARTNLTGLLERGEGVGRRVVFQTLQGSRQHEITALDTVVATVIEEPMGASQPAACSRHLPVVQQHEAKPERATDGPRPVAQAQTFFVGTCEESLALLILAREICCLCQPLQAIYVQRSFLVGSRQDRVCIAPATPGEGNMACVQSGMFGHTDAYSRRLIVDQFVIPVMGSGRFQLERG